MKMSVLGRGVAFAALFGLAGCGGDDCQSCSTASSCPGIRKQCPGYTATVQQCSGTAGQSCCARSEAEVQCTALSAAAGSYTITKSIVSFTPADSRQCLRYWIDARENGWVDARMSPAEIEATIRSKMAEVSPASTAREAWRAVPYSFRNEYEK
jgi:hypothetical protein